MTGARFQHRDPCTSNVAGAVMRPSANTAPLVIAPGAWLAGARLDTQCLCRRCHAVFPGVTIAHAGLLLDGQRAGLFAPGDLSVYCVVRFQPVGGALWVQLGKAR